MTPALGVFVAADDVPSINGKIAFATERDGNQEIYVMNADGSGQTRLTDNNASWTFTVQQPAAGASPRSTSSR